MDDEDDGEDGEDGAGDDARPSRGACRARGRPRRRRLALRRRRARRARRSGAGGGRTRPAPRPGRVSSKSGQSLSAEHELGVGDCQSRKFDDAQLARRADEEIGVGISARTGGAAIAAELLDRSSRLDAALAGEPERPRPGSPGARRSRTRSRGSGACSPRSAPRAPRCGAESLAGTPAARLPTKRTRTPSLGEVRQLAVDRLAEELHQRLDLFRAGGPVLGRERVHRRPSRRRGRAPCSTTRRSASRRRGGRPPPAARGAAPSGRCRP